MQKPSKFDDFQKRAELVAVAGPGDPNFVETLGASLPYLSSVRSTFWKRHHLFRRVL